MMLFRVQVIVVLCLVQSLLHNLSKVLFNLRYIYYILRFVVELITQRQAASHDLGSGESGSRVEVDAMWSSDLQQAPSAATKALQIRFVFSLVSPYS